MSRLARIAISIGDPAGVGAEIALKALSDPTVASLAQWLLVADRAALDAAARVCAIDAAKLPFTLVETNSMPAEPLRRLRPASRRVWSRCHRVRSPRRGTLHERRSGRHGHRAAQQRSRHALRPRLLRPHRIHRRAHRRTPSRACCSTLRSSPRSTSARIFPLEQACRLDRARIVEDHPTRQRRAAMDAAPRTAHRRLRPQSACRRARALRRGRISEIIAARHRGSARARASTAPARTRPTPSSSAPCAANST